MLHSPHFTVHAKIIPKEKQKEKGCCGQTLSLRLVFETAGQLQPPNVP